MWSNLGYSTMFMNSRNTVGMTVTYLCVSVSKEKNENRILEIIENKGNISEHRDIDTKML